MALGRHDGEKLEINMQFSGSGFPKENCFYSIRNIFTNVLQPLGHVTGIGCLVNTLDPEVSNRGTGK